jgi:hypothetical protein
LKFEFSLRKNSTYSYVRSTMQKNALVRLSTLPAYYGSTTLRSTAPVYILYVNYLPRALVVAMTLRYDTYGTSTSSTTLLPTVLPVVLYNSCTVLVACVNHM